MPFDINAARKSGYSDEEIGGFLAKQHSNFDVQGAMKAGYSLDDIANRLDKPKAGTDSSKAPKGIIDKAIGVMNMGPDSIVVNDQLKKLNANTMLPGVALAQKATMEGTGLDPTNIVNPVANTGAVLKAVQHPIDALKATAEGLKRAVGVVTDPNFQPTAKEAPIVTGAKAAGTALDLAVPGAEGGVSAGESAVARALVPGARAATGKAIGAAEAAAGVDQVVPTVSNMAKRLDLPARERSFADIVNSVRGKMANKEPISPQDLVDFKDLVKQQYGAGKIAKGTKLDALTAGANKNAEAMLNELVPGRAPLSKDYATMRTIQNGLKTLAKAGAGASGIGLAGALLRKLAQ